MDAFAPHLLDGKINLKNLLPAEMEQLMVALGQPRYKWQQVWRWMYVRLVDRFEDMTDLSKDFRRKLEEVAVVPSMGLHLHQQSEAQDTDKFLSRWPTVLWSKASK